MSTDDVFVVVRACGERTAELCRRIVARELGVAGHDATRLALVEERPFSRALRTGLEAGLVANRTWTYCVDADVLLRPGAIGDLVAEAARHPGSLFCLEGRVVDRLLGRVRFAGNHLYRTALLAEALGSVEFSSRVIRPERHVKDQMTARGHDLRIADTVVGLHDFEQYRVDIFRKAWVHAVKFPRELERYALDWWREAGASDADLRVASWAPPLQRAIGGDVEIDRSRFPATLAPLLALAGLDEKAPLTDGAPLPDIASLIASFEPAPGALAFERFDALYGRDRTGPARAMLDAYGSLGTAMVLGGKYLGRLADALQRRAPRRRR